MEKLKFGVIGCGSFSDKHLSAMQRIDEIEIVAVCDNVVELAKKQAEKYNVPTYYADYKE